MNNRKNALAVLIIGVVLGILSIGAYRSFTDPRPPKTLEYYGNVEEDSTTPDGKTVSVIRPHAIQPFSFLNQDSMVFTNEQTNGKIYVTDFFFTTCQSICPVMSKSIKKLSDKMKDNPQVLFLSHTVDPETDTPAALKEYAARIGADTKRWIFLTGDKKDLYKIAREGYKVTAMEGDGGEEDFIHTQNFVLVDKEKRIRGYYDGTDSLEMGKLETDIKLLLKEYAYKENQ